VANIRSFPNNQDEYIGAEDVMRWHHGRSSGVFGADGNASVAPVLDTMAVTVSDGNGWLTNENGDGIVWWVDNEAKNGNKLRLNVDMSDAVLPRIDRVVVSWQTTNYVALPEVIILKGVPASKPVAPELTNDSMVRQISLAAIHIPAGVTAIDASMITDERLDDTVCGIVTEKVGVDTSVMQAQFESFWANNVADFENYMDRQEAAWESFFENVTEDNVLPVPGVDDVGKAVVVNKAGDGFVIGDAQTTIPVTSEIPEDADIWIDPDENSIEETHLADMNNPHNVTPAQIGAATVTDFSTVNARVNKFTSLKEGSTTGDAELQDIRVGWDGEEYANAGEAVRNQVADIHGNAIFNKKNIGLNVAVDFNTILTNGIYYVSSPNTHQNCPGKGGLLIVTEQKSVTTQNFFDMFDGAVYSRYGVNGSWKAWKCYQDPRTINNYGNIGVDSSVDLNTIVKDGVYYISTPNEHVNNPGKGGVLLVTVQKSVVTQTFFDIFDGAVYSRWAMNGEFEEWVCKDQKDKTGVYYAFGDSTTYGQIAVAGGKSPYNYPSVVGKRLGMKVVNKGVGGQGLLKDWDTIHTDFVSGLDMSDATLVTIGWAYNDGSTYYSQLNFGTYEDTTPDTFIGKYYTIMKEFQEKCPNAMVVLITGYGMSGDYPQFKERYNFLDGLHSVKEMYDTIEQMCNFNGWNCINQAKGTWVTKYNWSTYIGDNIHPTEEGYKKYSNFIAAKMETIYPNYI
jgi:lysophospholipase L1-like esterase